MADDSRRFGGISPPGNTVSVRPTTDAWQCTRCVARMLGNACAPVEEGAAAADVALARQLSWMICGDRCLV
ncbi:hypothetical protein [Xanthomonas vesicatoria]|uniref:hypothetical protein n=1 Tax=Xanthomonas vesicatoria TaxID=56460 RepID=UPI001E450109|nr:hypothetical protein [Xanthomonas vesicatoria]MCC8619070.1 hypothetical protein [Xanthomonas vesicatoria]MCC8632652.1 hypothetical protein [Xanthomonas vesicatoria]